jgi:hypothetical protein
VHVVRKFIVYVIRAQQNYCASKQHLQKLQLRVKVKLSLRLIN